jgi:ComF family protein
VSYGNAAIRRYSGVMTSPFQAATRFAVDLVYPRRCAGCGRRGTWLCLRCEGELERFSLPWCPRCGVPIAINHCQCRDVPASLDHVRSVGPFAGWLRSAIIQFKYHGEWGRAEHLAPLLANACRDLPSVDAVVPVPLHASRLRSRGFNQSSLLAQHIAPTLSAPVADILVRSRPTQAQARLGAEHRRANVAGAFALRPNPHREARACLLIDDVITTGATLAACADTLRAAGAVVVGAATLAREM